MRGLLLDHLIMLYEIQIICKTFKKQNNNKKKKRPVQWLPHISTTQLPSKNLNYSLRPPG